jgi:hypothetical protein
MSFLAEPTLFALTFAIAATLRSRKTEALAAALHGCVLAALLSGYDVVTQATLVAFGFVMATAEVAFVSLDVWSYKNARYKIPMWLPFVWSIAGAFLLWALRFAGALFDAM